MHGQVGHFKELKSKKENFAKELQSKDFQIKQKLIELSKSKILVEKIKESEESKVGQESRCYAKKERFSVALILVLLAIVLFLIEIFMLNMF